VIRQVLNNDYAAMYTTQIDERRGFRYPPFYRLINITVKHANEEKTNKAAHEFALMLKPVFGTQLLGPEYPLISKIKAYHLMSMMLKFERGTDLAETKHTLTRLLEKFYAESPHKAVRIIVDVDPS
jgi:primosomal protein N' (replication factor Y)